MQNVQETGRVGGRRKDLLSSISGSIPGLSPYSRSQVNKTKAFIITYYEF